MKYLKLFEEFNDSIGFNGFNIYDPEEYLDEYLMSDDYEIYEEDIEDNPELKEKALRDIQDVIDYVKGIQYPIKVYRGLENYNYDTYKHSDEDLGCWSTSYEVAKSFTNKDGVLFHGIINSIDEVDIEQTIRTNILVDYENEINVKDSTKVEIIKVEKGSEIL
jgi:hypothetical protein